MCFGAPSNPPVMCRKPVKRKPVHTVEEIRPYWNGAFRTEDELPAIMELLEAVPDTPGIEMHTVKVSDMPPRQEPMESEVLYR